MPGVVIDSPGICRKCIWFLYDFKVCEKTVKVKER